MKSEKKERKKEIEIKRDRKVRNNNEELREEKEKRRKIWRQEKQTKIKFRFSENTKIK